MESIFQKRLLPTAEQILSEMNQKDNEITLWSAESLQKYLIEKINYALSKTRLTYGQVLGYVEVIHKTESCCSNTDCENCGMCYLLEYLENKDQNAKVGVF